MPPSTLTLQVRNWVDSIVQDWAFTSIIPCHFAGPIKTSPAEFKRAFAFAYEDEAAEAAAAPSSSSSRQQAPAGFLAGMAALFGGRPAKVSWPSALTLLCHHPAVSPS